MSRLKWSCLILAAGCLGCTQQSAEPMISAPTLVVVARPTVRDNIRDYEEFTGHTDAYRSVQIKARVSGYLLKKNFLDGAYVKKDDILYEIDDRPYKAALESAESSVAQNRAHKARLAADYRRASNLFERAAIGKQEFDMISGDNAESDAQLEASKAQLENAQLNMDFTKVRAPMDGQLSRTLVDPGNLIRQDRTILNDIVFTSQLYAYFDLSVDEMERVNREIELGLVGGDDGEQIEVYFGTTLDQDRYDEGKRRVRSIAEEIAQLEARKKLLGGQARGELKQITDAADADLLRIEANSKATKDQIAGEREARRAKLATDHAARRKKLDAALAEIDSAIAPKQRKLAEDDRAVPPEFPYRGKVNFAENKLDAATGTLRVRGEITNPESDTSLIPGLFIRVHLPIGETHKALLVPEDAIGSDQGRTYVYVVNAKGEVEYRPIELGAVFDGEAGTKLRAVRSGITADERFIKDSDTIRRVRPGARVQVDETDAKVAQADPSATKS